MKYRKKRKIFFISGLMVLLAIIAAAIWVYGMVNRTTKSPVLKNSTRNESWKADLKFVKTELPKKHKNLFFSKSKSEFNADMDSLIGKIEKYSDIEMKAELAKIINSVNDSHTSVNIQGDLVYPLSFFQFENDIYLTNSSLEYKDFWGKKLVGINGYSIEQLRSKFEPFVPKDNKAISENEFPSFLKYVESLKAAGIAKSDDAVFTFEGVNQNSITVKPLDKDSYQKTKFLSNEPEYLSKFPLPKQRTDNYWFKYIEDKNTVYVKYNACSNTKNYSFSSFTKDVFKAVDNNRAQTLIVDLRDNGGGNSMIFNPFLKEIKKRDNINKKENLFVIIGRRTFSSAILNAMDLKNTTNATLVGESTGGKPNHFGEVKVLRLSNVNIDLYYSSNYFRTTKKDTDSLYPDVEIPLKAASYFSGKDDFLDYILNKNIGK